MTDTELPDRPQIPCPTCRGAGSLPVDAESDTGCEACESSGTIDDPADPYEEPFIPR